MKIYRIVLLSVAFSSPAAYAFQAKSAASAEVSASQLKKAEESIVSNFYSHNDAGFQTSILGTCSATPVPGCHCAFCTMLRGGA
ncbi:hypothetical protein CD006_15205 [Enterobacter sp. 10-1]|jgi:hypothetical protein|uniref:hypothetical protein n=1 Tax=Raoultella TaxID=160674 RepID=UPI000BA32077|nr:MULTISPECIES: hypothetical protein [Enterobacteriaceae]MVT03963.1 hypothetical protein [Raoultella sp. 10-1]PAC11574.1 hypothetical protein CD006_15205 [Enterobacter sp. 10-1]